MSPGLLFLTASAYLLLLFGIAHAGDRQAARKHYARKPWAWSLALAVYCTSWTYYGAVGRAAESNWSYLPIYLGPMLVFIFGHRLLERMIELAKRNSLTSLPDFVAARYGKDRTFSVPILMLCALGGRLGEGREAWRRVLPLPFEIAALPRRLKRAESVHYVTKNLVQHFFHLQVAERVAAQLLAQNFPAMLAAAIG